VIEVVELAVAAGKASFFDVLFVAVVLVLRLRGVRWFASCMNSSWCGVARHPIQPLRHPITTSRGARPSHPIDAQEGVLMCTGCSGLGAIARCKLRPHQRVLHLCFFHLSFQGAPVLDSHSSIADSSPPLLTKASAR
jgi:hypothetical protein